ncbi:MAG: class I SAM-dependent methyltransferase [Ignavibacteriae bacterium]|nr:class I SAM-dependent methyltransferase [Ignavibacteriota bacterium]NOG97888.1 class I SAM-dependent methyltransferase [Ignavibacteriota bacterium]
MVSTCPLCEKENYDIIGGAKSNPQAEKFIDKNYKVAQCRECEGYYVVPRISFTDDQWAELYSNEYFAMQSNWLLKKRALELSNRFDTALKFLPQKEITFLDIGAGEGKTLIEGAKRGWDVTGIDIVDSRIDSAKSKGIKFIEAKFMEYDFPENHFDFIYLDSVLEHVINPKQYLQKINQILKPGGILYVAVPNEDCLFNDVRRFVFILLGRKNISVKIKPFDTPYHIIGYNKNSLSFIFNETNFKIKLMQNTGRMFNFLGHKPTGRGFWINLFFLFPVEIIGKLIKKDVYYESYVQKKIDI